MPVAADIYYHLYEGSKEGQNPSLVLIHGAGGTHINWPPNIRRLPGRRVYALDLPGHGKSHGRGFQSIAAYSQAVLNWMGSIGLFSAVFVGHSMGSAIAMTLALGSPDHVLGLGLLGAGARLRVAPALLESCANQTTFYNAISTIVSWSYAPNASDELTDLARKRLAETRPSVLNGDFLACDAFDEMERIAQIDRPTLVVCGSEDKMTPVRYSQYLADSIPGASLKIIPDAGHMLMLEQPAAVAAALEGFLGEIPFGFLP